MRTSVNTQTVSFPLHLFCLKRLACVSSFFTFNQSCLKLPFCFFAIPLAFCFHGCEVTLIFSSFSLLLIYFGIVKDYSYVTHLNWPLYNFDTFIFSSLGSFVSFQAVSSFYVLLGIVAVKFESEINMSVDWPGVAFCDNSCPEGAHSFVGMLVISQIWEYGAIGKAKLIVMKFIAFFLCEMDYITSPSNINSSIIPQKPHGVFIHYS